MLYIFCYRDLSSGYLVAEILSLYFPHDIELPLFVNASSLNVKLSNWQRLKKVICSCIIQFVNVVQVYTETCQLAVF